MFKKEMKAPAWFIKNVKERERLRGELLELLGVSDEYLKSVKPESFHSLIHQFDEKIKNKAENITAAGIYLADYNWALFRVKNFDNEYGIAEALNYNPKKQIITIEESPMEKIKTLAKKVFGDNLKGVEFKAIDKE